MKFSVEKRWSTDIAFTVDIDCKKSTSEDWKLRLAILKAIELKIDISGADISGADISYTDMRGVNMRGVDMSCSDMRCADMRGANMSGADIRCARMSYADMRGANMSYTNISGANMSYTNMRGADISGSDMSCTKMRGADMSGVNMRGVVNLHYSHCPEDGSFIAWKKLSEGFIAKLEIPENAKRTSSIVGRKCRAEFVKVIAIYNGDKEVLEGISSYNNSKTIYKVGEIVTPDSYDNDPRVECTNGIHFFITKQEAMDY